MENYGRQKYLEEKHLPHIGEMVKREVERSRLSLAQLGKILGVNGNAVSKYYLSRSMQAGLVLKLSKALNHDFFSEILEGLPEDYPRKPDETSAQKVAELEAEIEDLKKELAIYKDIVAAKH